MRVLVAISGGVDSAAAAALLMREGHEVVGVTLQLADLSREGLGASRCCSTADIGMAREVADRLGIQHYIIDMEMSFEKAVLRPFVESYLSGETPLPCAHCNSSLKFGELLTIATQLGAEFLATGHYARIERGADRPVLLRGRDVARDQSYFLFGLRPEQLGRVLFPLGGMRKDEVRAFARSVGLPNADRRDSQEVCFVPAGGSYMDVLQKLAADRLPGPGDVVDRSGNVLGRHAGFQRFTIGQRRGIGLPGTRRFYVIEVRPQENRVVVGRRDDALRGRLRIRDVNWLAAAEPGTVDAQVQIRSRHSAQPAVVTLDGGGGADVEFVEPVMAPAPGQAAVCYDGDRLLGGGWIVSAD
jgi:tRNA-specific 2-thiouridylase